MMRLLLPALCLVGCRAEAPDAVDWCAEPLDGPASPRVAADGGLIYEIYVRSFQDTDGDGMGDLAGVRAHLDYLAGLGVTTIWLMPIFESPEIAGYASSDFVAVNADYGDQEDLDALITAASAQGMRVILDAPINHTSDAHPWFQAALADPEGPEALDYRFARRPHGDEPWYPTEDGTYYYAYFGPTYPDLDLTRPSVAEAVTEALGGWLDLGVGGFRLDAVVQLIEEDGDLGDTPASHCLLAWMNQRLHAEHPDALLLSEAWSRNVDYNLAWLGEDEAPQADLALDVPRRRALLEAWTTGEPSALLDVLQTQVGEGRTEQMAPYLSTHDVARLSQDLPDVRWRRASMVFHLLGPGQPILYYGDELDLPMAPESGQDEAQRAPMLWDDTDQAGFSTAPAWYAVDPRYRDGYNVAAEAEDPDSMLSLVRALAELRAESAAIQTGETALLPTEDPALFALSRSAEAEGLIVILNLSDRLLRGQTLDLASNLGEWTALSTGRPLTPTREGLALPDLAPYGYLVLGSPALAGTRIPGPVDEDADALRTP